MGVHGLTTYLRTHQRILSKTVNLSSKSPGQDLHIVVDAWSFIYEIFYKSSTPWVYGGEYREFYDLVTVVVKSWVDIGLSLSFVFDGPQPSAKMQTEISRNTQSKIQPAILFFRTSTVSRSLPRFLKETRIIPPLFYDAMLDALNDLKRGEHGIDIHFADEECDPFAVELAGRLGAYVAGNDSDFVVLNSPGYKGYIPLSEMVWECQDADIDTPVDVDNSDGFQPVSPKKRGTRLTSNTKAGNGLLPPNTGTILSLSFTVYDPALIATHLKLPISLLPLLGAIVGNDYTRSPETGTTTQNMQQLFFHRKSTLIERIDLTASIISSILTTRRPKHKVDSVMDLIRRTLAELLSRTPTTLGSGEVEDLVNTVVTSTLQYAIPRPENSPDQLWSTPVCALHDPDFCTILPLFSRAASLEVANHIADERPYTLEQKLEIRDLYLRTYRMGLLSPLIVDCLNTGTHLPRSFLESPDIESVVLLTRPLRLWWYAILDDAVGLPEPVETEEEQSVLEAEEEDEDELIDVVESDEEDETARADLLAPLRGALQRLHESDEEGTEPPLSVVSTDHASHARRRVILEYVRRGTRTAAETVEVPSLQDILDSSNFDDLILQAPLLLSPPDFRLTFLLRIFNSDRPSIRGLSAVELSVALALRFMIEALDARARESPGREKESQRWTLKETRCFLASCVFESHGTPATTPTHPVPIIDRSIQLTAQALGCLEGVEHLAQVLLLTDLVASPTRAFFSGKLFHSYLVDSTPIHDGCFSSLLFEACIDGIEHCLGEERQPKRKKKSKDSGGGKKGDDGKTMSYRSVYELLGDATV